MSDGLTFDELRTKGKILTRTPGAHSPIMGLNVQDQADKLSPLAGRIRSRIKSIRTIRISATSDRLASKSTGRIDRMMAELADDLGELVVLADRIAELADIDLAESVALHFNGLSDAIHASVYLPLRTREAGVTQ
jgi:hypothetical protein